MTPIKLFLIQLVIILFVLLLLAGNKEDDKATNLVKTIGGIVVISVFGTAIWAIFYYL